MASAEVLEAELAVKTNLVEALNAENEQLRLLLQKHADRADAEHTSRLAKGDMRRESNINELQAVIAHMRTQLYENASDRDAQNSSLADLKVENAQLKAERADIVDEMHALKQRLTMMQAQLAEEQAKYDAEREKVLALRAGLEESKKAIGILKESSDRRNSEVASRRASDNHTTLGRQNSLVSVNVNVARRGSLNYLTGLGLTSKRLNHFDPGKKLLLGSARTESDLAGLAASTPLPPSDQGSPNTLNRRNSLPASPHNYEPRQHGSLGLVAISAGAGDGPTFGALSRRSSLHAGRRSSLGLDSPTRRSMNLSNAMIRLTGTTGEDGDLPLARRASTTIEEDKVTEHFTALPEMGVRRRASGSLGGERRRSSVHGPAGLRRGSERNALSGLAEYSFPSPDTEGSVGLPPTVAEEAYSPAMSAGSVSFPMDMRTATYPPHEPDGVVKALSMEAAMEISSLKELIADLKMRLLEADESREASETCARALRQFIANQAAEQEETVKLPPLPTDTEAAVEAEEVELKRKHASSSGEQDTAKESKRTSRWGMPKLLPSLSYSAIRRDASNSIAGHLPPVKVTLSEPEHQLQVPAAARTRSSSNGSTHLSASGGSPSVPAWRTNRDLRHLSVSSGMSGGGSSAAPSPILSSGVPNFQSTFNSFSFSAVQYRQPSTIEEPPSPGGGSDSPTFSSISGILSDGASSTDAESENEGSLPATPLDATFGDRAELAKERAEEEQRLARDPTMTPRPVQSF